MSFPVVHFEIGCRDKERAATFYRRLFNWDISDSNGVSMIATGGNEGIDGHITALGHEPHRYVTVYVQVEDIHAHLEKVHELGGKTIVPATDVPEMGQFAWFEDLDGNIVGLWKSYH